MNVVNKSNGTIQFNEKATIEDSEEMDLFGYMKTVKNDNSSIRSAAVRLSHAISLEEYKNDIELLNNKGFADRIGEFPNLANIEQHLSYYTYTVTIDLTKIGKDDGIEIDNKEKAKRVNQLLEIIKVLNRDIRGREENLSPVFVIGGMYNLNSPYFLGRIKLDNQNGEYKINTNMLKDTVTLKVGENSIFDDTKVGIVKDTFKNEKEIEELFNGKINDIQMFFEDLEKQVVEYYK